MQSYLVKSKMTTQSRETIVGSLTSKVIKYILKKVKKLVIARMFLFIYLLIIFTILGTTLWKIIGLINACSIELS